MIAIVKACGDHVEVDRIKPLSCCSSEVKSTSAHKKRRALARRCLFA